MKILAIVVLILIIAALLWLGFWLRHSATNVYDGFARCLADKGITMYGAKWCSFCQKEKSAFSYSFRLVPYVECPDNPKLCLEKGVDNFPTWVFPDGKKLVGFQGLSKLSEESGCPLPQTNEN